MKVFLPFAVLLYQFAVSADQVGVSHFRGWKPALPPKEYSFPSDHFSHEDFKTEWWYFTGHLQTETGDRYGFQWTLFRQGVQPPAGRRETKSQFVQNHFYFGHAALSDLSRKKFYYQQIASRGAFDEAGAVRSEDGGTSGAICWIGDWRLELLDHDPATFRLIGRPESGIVLDLKLRAKKRAIFNGENGVSQKADGVGNASHYYSISRMGAEGKLLKGGRTTNVKGEAWLDREWGSNQLTENQTGWDWFSLQFDDGSELMLYQIRDKSGQSDPNSSGTFIDSQGNSLHLKEGDFALTPRRRWKSEKSGGNYPIDWRVRVPDLGIDLEVKSEFENQELALPSISYWEGAVTVTGSHQGQGYLELSGYAGSLSGLR